MKVAAAEQLVSAGELRYKELEQQYEEATHRIKELEQSMKENSKMDTHMKEELEQSIKNTKEMSQQLQQLQENLSILRSENTQLKKESDNYQAKLSQKEKELENTIKVKETLKEAENRIHELEVENKKLAAQASKMDQSGLVADLQKLNQETQEILEKERQQHKEEMNALKKKMNDDSAITNYFDLLSRTLQGEDILENKNEKGCEVDKRTCHACHANLVNSLSKDVSHGYSRLSIE